MEKLCDLLENECWWGGSIVNGDQMPFTKDTDVQIDLRGLTTGQSRNQHMPLLLSNKGRYVWSDEGLAFAFRDGVLYAEGENVTLYEAGDTLRDAYLAASKRHFPFDGKPLPDKFFTTAQYNIWMQVTYNPTQEKVLEYARGIVDNGFEPGVLIIDEGWHKPYGQWEFDPIKFPDPKGMMDTLHQWGFTVMLWVCPFVTCSGERYIKSIRGGSEMTKSGVSNNLYLRLDNGQVALTEWWNGVSAILDMTKEGDVRFLKTQLDTLVTDYGVDGFKFDGGQIYNYSDFRCVNGHVSRESTHYQRNIAWNEFGRQYPFHEYKDTYKGGGKCGIQRLLDRMHSWTRDGINTILPYSLVQGLLGSPFICPDMIGGGDWVMLQGLAFDEELFVRMCQVSTLFPMMQFSMAPWQYLSEENLAICLNMVELHKAMSTYILELVNESRFSGEPLVRHLEYAYPHQGYETTTDIFMLGDRYLVAPVLTKGAVTRAVRLPVGSRWRYVDGTVYEGGTSVEVDAPLAVLPYFEKVSLNKL